MTKPVLVPKGAELKATAPIEKEARIQIFQQCTKKFDLYTLSRIP